MSVDVDLFGAASFGASRRLRLVDECPAALPCFWILLMVVFAVDFCCLCAVLDLGASGFSWMLRLDLDSHLFRNVVCKCRFLSLEGFIVCNF